MKNKYYIFMLFLLSGAMYSQTNANPNIIKKEIKANNAIDIYDQYYPKNNINSKLTPKITGNPVYYYNKKFYTKDILKKLSPDSIYRFEIIKSRTVFQRISDQLST